MYVHVCMSICLSVSTLVAIYPSYLQEKRPGCTTPTPSDIQHVLKFNNTMICLLTTWMNMELFPYHSYTQHFELTKTQHTIFHSLLVSTSGHGFKS